MHGNYNPPDKDIAYSLKAWRNVGSATGVKAKMNFETNKFVRKILLALTPYNENHGDALTPYNENHGYVPSIAIISSIIPSSHGLYLTDS
jgi:hypothetical protein